jgi:5-methylcytosine-specific restriction endonuclease McrA
MEQTLVLNSSYEPLKVVDWQRAITLWFQGKAEIVEEHDTVIRSVSFTMKMPSVVRLLYFIKQKRRPVVQFTRANIYARDEFTCQYCAGVYEPEDLTFDHIVPVAQGGRRGWTNIVTACEPCNRRKAARTPEEAGMTLLRQPKRPLVLAPAMKLTIGWKTPANWYSYLYWNVSLEKS